MMQTEFISIDFIGSIIGAIIGVFIAFLLTVVWDKWKKSNEVKETKLNACDGIIGELNSNLNLLKIMTEMISNEDLKAHKPDEITDIVFKGIISSKLFFILDINIQKSMLEIYRNIDIVKKQADFMRTLASNSFILNEKQLKELQTKIGKATIHEVNARMEIINELIPKIIKDIESYKLSLK